MGLGLTFWGALLIFVRTTLYVKGQLLEGVPTYLPPKQLIITGS